MKMTNKRIADLLASAILWIESELDERELYDIDEDMDEDEARHEWLLNDLSMTESEYKEIMRKGGI